MSFDEVYVHVGKQCRVSRRKHGQHLVHQNGPDHVVITVRPAHIPADLAHLVDTSKFMGGPELVAHESDTHMEIHVRKAGRSARLPVGKVVAFAESVLRWDHDARGTRQPPVTFQYSASGLAVLFVRQHGGGPRACGIQTRCPGEGTRVKLHQHECRYKFSKYRLCMYTTV